MEKSRQNLNLIQLLDDHHIEYRGSDSKWISLACPFCYKGDGKFGLGWSGTAFNCFKCGRLGQFEVIAALLDQTLARAAKTLSKYRGHTKTIPRHLDGVGRNLTTVPTVILPYGTAKMTARHQNYLKTRNFDPNQLEQDWGLLGTGPVGPFAYRIIIPILYKERLVCYQSRDITNKSKMRYKTCPDTEAIQPVKDCLYGIDKVPGDSIVVTEGVTKVWRLGPGSVATFGALTSDAQVKLLISFKKIFILFDEDRAGQDGAAELAWKISVFGLLPIIITVGIKDVAELSNADARGLMKDLLK